MPRKATQPRRELHPHIDNVKRKPHCHAHSSIPQSYITMTEHTAAKSATIFLDGAPIFPCVGPQTETHLERIAQCHYQKSAPSTVFFRNAMLTVDIKNAAGAAKYVNAPHGHAATSLAPGMKSRACNVHENAGHVPIATENVRHQITNSVIVPGEKTQSDKCEVHKNQHFLKRNPPPHLKHFVRTSHHGIVETFVCWCTVANAECGEHSTHS